MFLSVCLFPLKSVAQSFEQVEVQGKQVVFRIHAPETAKPLLRLYEKGQAGKPFKTVKMKHAGGDLFVAKVKKTVQSSFPKPRPTAFVNILTLVPIPFPPSFSTILVIKTPWILLATFAV